MRYPILLLAFFLSLPFTEVFAQSENTVSGAAVASGEEEQLTVIEKIAEESNGNIDIIVDGDLARRILTPPESRKKKGGGGQVIRPGINKISGYRIQVFSDGRNQHSLEARAKARGSAIVAKFPKYRGQIYTFSSSPNWYTRVGNFTSAAEADRALGELRNAFPAFAQEMRVVKSQIVVIK